MQDPACSRARLDGTSKINQAAPGQQCRLIEVGQNKAPSEILIPRGRVVFSVLRLGLCYTTKEE